MPSAGIKPGNVPTARIGPILDALIRERWPYGNGQEVLAEKVGCDESAIWSIVNQTNPGVEFDLADSLLCALGRWDIWHGVLEDIYPTKFMETCSLSSCGKRFPEGRWTGSRRKLYCCRTCRDLAAGVRRGHCVGHRMRQRNKCNKGHKLSADNVLLRKNGKRECRACRNERDRRRWHEDIEYRTRKQGQIDAWKQKASTA